jgi:hypothetical protein
LFVPAAADELLEVVLLVVLLDELDIEDELLVVELVLLVELELVLEVVELEDDDVDDGLLLDVIVLDELLVAVLLQAFGLPGAPVWV